MMHVTIDSTRNVYCWATRLDYQSGGLLLQILSKYLTLPSILTFTPSDKHYLVSVHMHSLIAVLFSFGNVN